MFNSHINTPSVDHRYPTGMYVLVEEKIAQNALNEEFKQGVKMLTVSNIQPINKGSVICKCDVHIAPWKMTLKEVMVFQKGAQRWINLPSKQYTNESGETKYTEVIAFDNDAIKTSFRNQITSAIDAYLEQNPEMKVEDAIKPDDTFPF